MNPGFQLLLTLYASGFLAVQAAAKGTRPYLAAVLGLPLGLLYFNAVSLMTFTAGVPYRPDVIAGGVLCVCIGWFSRSLGKAGFRRTITHTALMLVAAAAILYLLSSFDAAIFSYDSTKQMLAARMIGMRGAFDPISVGEFSSWGVFLVLSQAPAGYFGGDFIPALHPALAVSFTLLFMLTVHSLLATAGLGMLKRAAVAILTGLAVFSTYFMLFHAFYVHNNLMMSFYLFLCVTSLHQMRNQPDFFWQFVTACALLAMSFVRTEAPLYATIVIGAAWLWAGIPTKTIRRLCTITTIPVVGWYAYLISHMGEGGVILTPATAVVAVAPLAGLLILTYISTDSLRDRFSKASAWAAAAAAGLITVVLFLRQPGHMSRSFIVILRNLHNHGRWGLGWHVVTGLAMVSVLLRPAKKHHHWIFGVLALLGWLIFSLSAFRTPYRIGWGDSANRMFVHLFPLAWIWVLLNFAATNQSSKRSSTNALEISNG